MSFSDKFIRRNSLAIANKKFNKFFKQRSLILYDFKSKNIIKKRKSKKYEKEDKQEIEKISDEPLVKLKKKKKYSKEKVVKFRLDNKMKKKNLKLIFNPKKKLFNKIKEKIHEPEVLLIIRYKIIFLYFFINIFSLIINIFFYLNDDHIINQFFAKISLFIIILTTLMRVMILKFLDYKSFVISFLYNLFHFFFWISIHSSLSKIKRSL